jgi:transcriptional regulator with XRE-family HTH domain
MTTRLRRYLDEQEMTLEAFAERATILKRAQRHDKTRPRITSSMVAKWASGKATPSLENALAINATSLDSVPLSSLLVR